MSNTNIIAVLQQKHRQEIKKCHQTIDSLQRELEAMKQILSDKETELIRERLKHVS